MEIFDYFCTMHENIDINETTELRQDAALMEKLLKDHTTQRNIFWTTDGHILKLSRPPRSESHAIPISSMSKMSVEPPEIPGCKYLP